MFDTKFKFSIFLEIPGGSDVVVQRKVPLVEKAFLQNK